MISDVSMKAHQLLQILQILDRFNSIQLDTPEIIDPLGDILQFALPHDFIDLIWLDDTPSEQQAVALDLAKNSFTGPISSRTTPILLAKNTHNSQGQPILDHRAWLSGLFIPLTIESKLIGVLELGSSKAEAFSQEQQSFAIALAHFIASPIQRTHLLQRERQQWKRQQTLERIHTAITASLNISDIFDTFALQVAQLIHFEAISVTLLSDDDLLLERFALATTVPITARVGDHLRLDETAIGLAVRGGQTVSIHNMFTDERLQGSNDLLWIAEGFSSVIMAPLRLGSRIIGTLNVLMRTPHFYTAEDVTTLEQIAAMVAANFNNMHTYARTQQTVIIEERSRLAYDIHDTLTYSLSGLISQLDATEQSHQDDERLGAELKHIRQMARRTLSEMRSLIWDLRPNPTPGRSLPQALEATLNVWKQTSGIPAKLFVRGEGKLSAEVESALLRIVQEALHNTQKHARAREVRVELEYNTQDVHLLLTDDGVGFELQKSAYDSTPGKDGFGLIAMRERTIAEGGHFYVSSWPNNGTRIEVSFQLETQKKTARIPERNVLPATLSARALIVDNQVLVRQGLVELVRNIEGLCVVGEADNGYSAIEMVRRLQPDLVLMDMRLPGLDGAAVTKLLLTERPGLRVIMLTSSDASEDLTRAIEAGARGYILKDASVEQLEETIKAVLRGEAVVEQRITHHLFDRFNHLLQGRHQSDVLSARELEVLRLMVEGYRNKDIATTLVLSEHTIKSHISSLFQKLGVHDRAGAISIALSRNLCDMSPDQHSSFLLP